MKYFIKKILPVWAVYTVVINLYVYLLVLFNFIQVKNSGFKEVFLALWGYGWDGMHYIKIAQTGYVFPLQAFFPVYPLIIKAVNFVLPLSVSFRMNILLSLIALLLLYFFTSLLKIEKTNRQKIFILFLALPTAFFLQANYTETLYLILAMISLYLCLKRKYLFAAAIAGVLSGIKVTGVIMGVVILISFYKHYFTGFSLAAPSRKKLALQMLLLALLSFSGLIGYFVFLHFKFGSFLIFFKAQAEWGREFIQRGSSIIDYIASYFTPFYKALITFDKSLYRRAHEIIVFILATFVLSKMYKKVNLEIWTYSLLQIFVPVATGTLMSFNRLVLLAFPVVLWGLNLINLKGKKFWILVTLLVIDQLFGLYLFYTNVFIG